MPILRERSDGRFYIRAWMPGTTNIGTWQLHKDGLAYLNSIGITKDGDRFDWEILNLLKEKGWVFTAGTGFNGPTTPDPTALDLIIKPDPQPKPEPVRRGASLRILINKTDWQIAIFLREIPRGWAKSTDDIVASLQSWAIQVEQTKVPAMRLYPGQGGALVPVAPAQGRYSVHLLGTWPKAWSVQERYFSVLGLSEGITIFDEERGERIAPNSQLESGKSYVLAGNKGLNVPPEIIKRNLDSLDEWNAWRITIPKAPSDQLVQWFQQFKMEIKSPWSKVTLLTPVIAYTTNDQPIIKQDGRIIVAIPFNNAANPAIKYFELPNPGIGRFQITLDDLPVKPLSIDVRADDQVTLPQPLQTIIRWHDQTTTLRAFTDSSTTFQPVHADETSLEVTVLCLVPVKLTLSGSPSSEQMFKLDPAEASERIKRAMLTAVRRGQNLSVRIDGQAFGAVTFAINPQPVSPPPDPADTTIHAYLRRLAILATVPHRQHAVVSLPSRTQQTLQQLAITYHYPQLRNVRRVAPNLLPMINTIVKLVNERNNHE